MYLVYGCGAELRVMYLWTAETNTRVESQRHFKHLWLLIATYSLREEAIEEEYKCKSIIIRLKRSVTRLHRLCSTHKSSLTWSCVGKYNLSTVWLFQSASFIIFFTYIATIELSLRTHGLIFASSRSEEGTTRYGATSFAFFRDEEAMKITGTSATP